LLSVPGFEQPPVVRGLAGQVADQVPQVRAGVPDPAGPGGVARQRLHDRQGHQLGVGQPGRRSISGRHGASVTCCLTGVAGV
jgi:hypothetical protein